MELKKEVVVSLKRELTVCKHAITHLQKKLKAFEEQYEMTTEEFLTKFEAGQLVDEVDLFKWYAIAEATRDWRKTYDSLKSLTS